MATYTNNTLVPIRQWLFEKCEIVLLCNTKDLQGVLNILRKNIKTSLMINE